MLIKYFTSNMPFQQLLGVFLVAVLMWLGYFTGHETWIVRQELEPLTSAVLTFDEQWPLLSGILAVVMFFIQALWINYLAQIMEFTSKTTFLPAFLFLLIALSLDENLMTGSVILGNFFALGVIHSLINAYHKQNTLRSVFHASLFTGIGSLFYFPVLALWLFIIIALIIYREISFKAILFSLFGLIPTFAGVTVYYFWKGQPAAHFQAIAAYLPDFNLQLHGQLPELLLAVMILLFLLISLSYTHRHIKEQVIRNRRTIMVLTWYLFFIFAISGYASAVLQQVVLMAPVIAIFLSHMIEGKKKNKWMEALLWIFVIVITFYRLQDWVQFVFDFSLPTYEIL